MKINILKEVEVPDKYLRPRNEQCSQIFVIRLLQEINELKTILEDDKTE